MYYVYFLKSGADGRIYIGSCKDVYQRFTRHNRGLVKSTKAYCPWQLLEYETFNTRGEAMRKEKFYKTGQQRELLKKRFINQ